jgi:predicted transposase YdaD
MVFCGHARCETFESFTRDMSEPNRNNHDSFFKNALSDPQHAGTFLREHLPPDVAGVLDHEEPLVPLPCSYVDRKLHQSHSDLLFGAHLKGGGNALVYVLLEHKSSPDKGARLQLLQYIVRVLVDCYERNRQQLPLPAVLPLLIHQGPEGWKYSCEFASLFGSVPEPLRPYLPSFRHALVDLGQIEDWDLSGQARLRAFLKALKYKRRPDLRQRIDILLAEAPVLAEPDLVLILTYLEDETVGLSDALMREALQRLVPEQTERIMGTWTQTYFDQGKAEGLTEGRTEGLSKGLTKGLTKGRIEGGAKILVSLLEKRFGSVSPQLRKRIFSADVPTLEKWVQRVLDAQDLQSVFESN